MFLCYQQSNLIKINAPVPLFPKILGEAFFFSAKMINIGKVKLPFWLGLARLLVPWP